MGRKLRRKERREIIGQIAETCDREQDADDSRKKDRPEDKVAEEKAEEPEKHHADVESLSMKVERHGASACNCSMLNTLK